VQAIVRSTYGPPDVLSLADVDPPRVADDAVLVRVRATSVNPADRHVLRGDPYLARLRFGLRAPRHAILGCDVAGEVEAVGPRATGFRPGDAVFGCAFMRGFGTFAELAAVPADCLAPKPASLSFEQAAAVPTAALTALQGLRDHARLEPGQTVLVVGASGGVGTFAVQLAKHLGADVTGVCSGRNAELVRALGADGVVDYAQEDVLRGDRRYDVVFQLAGTTPAAAFRRVLTPKGTLLLSSGASDGRWLGPLTRVLGAVALSPFVGQRLASFTVRPRADDLRFLAGLLDAGALRPTIDRTYPLAELPDALRYLELGHARGKVVVAV
jgi:NADPH:quinone reductase-like Zn-dependent oxidoreductase